MASNEQIHSDLKELTNELKETNKIMIQVVADNQYRDKRLDSQEKKISDLSTDIIEIKEQRIQDREKYLPVWDKSKREQDDKAGYIKNIVWIGIVCFVLLVSNGISSGAIKLPFQGNNHAQKK